MSPIDHRTADTATRRVRRPTHPDEAERIVPALARWYLEYLGGRRSIDQVAALLSPAVRHRLERRRSTGLTPRQPTPDPAIASSTVTGTRLSWTSPTRCEALALVTRDGRTTALTITLQRYPERWRVTELSSPEDGVNALRATPVPVGGD